MPFKGIHNLTENEQNLADFISPSWLLRLNDVSERTGGGLIEYIVDSGQYSFPTAPQQKTFEIQVNDADATVEAIASDYDRFSSACFESLISVDQSSRSPRSIGWLVVSTYYSAYYAAHALLRSFGISCSNLDYSNAIRLTQVARTYFPGCPVISSSYYYVTFDYHQRLLSFEEVGGKGVHEGFWKRFNDYISILTPLIAARQDPLGIGQQLVLKLSDLQRILTANGALGGAWLSSVRNAVNYRHEYGVWFPFDSKKAFSTQFASEHKKWVRDPSKIDLAPRNGQEIKEFLFACLYICNICRVNTINLASKHNAGKSFLRNFSLKLLKQSKTE